MSINFTCPSGVISRLEGLMSRWTTFGSRGMGQGLGRLQHVTDRFRQRQRPLRLHHLPHVHPLDKLENDEVQPVVLAHVVHPGDVLVVEPGGRLGLVLKPQEGVRGRPPDRARGPSVPRCGPGGYRAPGRRGPCPRRRRIAAGRSVRGDRPGGSALGGIRAAASDMASEIGSSGLHTPGNDRRFAVRQGEPYPIRIWGRCRLAGRLFRLGGKCRRSRRTACGAHLTHEISKATVRFSSPSSRGADRRPIASFQP